MLYSINVRSTRYPLSGTVHVDDFYIGEYEEGKSGRSLDSKKRLVVVALEILEKGGVGRAYARIIERASGKDFAPFFKDHTCTLYEVHSISTDAHVVTDIWKGYLPLKKEYPNFEQKLSKKGANFPELHVHTCAVTKCKHNEFTRMAKRYPSSLL